MGEPSRSELDAENERSARLDALAEPLGRFLTSAPLPNGTTARLDPQIAGLLALVVVRWQDGDVWDRGRWVPVGEVMSTPEAGDVRVESLADGAVVKMTHVPSGLTALGEDVQSTWDDLKRKVHEHGAE